MSKQEFSKGPWGASDCGTVHQSGSGRLLAIVEGEANARLIAAAPELYQACQAAADWLSRSVRIDDREIAQYLRAALEKAGGGE